MKIIQLIRRYASALALLSVLMGLFAASYLIPENPDSEVFRTGTLGTLLHLKRAKANHLHLTIGLHALGNSGKSSNDSNLSILLGHAGLFSHGSNQFSLIHMSILQIKFPL